MTPNPDSRQAAEPLLALQLAAFAVSFLMVAASTLIGILIAPLSGQSTVVLLYLPPVLAAALYFGLWPSLTAALGSTLAFNYFFTAPFHTLQIASPADLVTVAMLFAVAVVTSRLAASLRDQARLVAAHAARNATIAGFARRLLSSADEQDIAGVVVHELSCLFGCNAVVIADAAEPKVIATAPADPALAAGDLARLSVEPGTLQRQGHLVEQIAE
jgi:K+-sensing histidine kinase KdpD